MIIHVFQNEKIISEISFLDEEVIQGSLIFCGRADYCHVKIDDKTVSRELFYISYEDGKLYLNPDVKNRDLIKISAKDINGKAVINNKDVITFRDYIITVDQFVNPVELNKRDDKLDIPGGQNEQSDQSDAKASSGSNNNQEKNDEQDIRDNDENSFDSSDDNDFIENNDDEFVGDSSLDNSNLNNDLGNSFSDGIDSDSEFNSLNDTENLDSDSMGLDDEDSSSNEFDSDSDSGFDESTESTEGGFDDDGFGGFDDDGGGDGFGDSSDSSDVGESTQVYKTFARYFLEIKGDFAPFDRFEVEENEVIIGRDEEKAQIHLQDPNVSSQHCKIKKTLIDLSLEDLGSANGTLYNGVRVNKTILGDGDTFQIGSTVFTVKVESELIDNEDDRLMPVDLNQEIEVEEIIEEEVGFDELEIAEGDASVKGKDQKGGKKSLLQQIKEDPKKKRMAIIIGGALFLMLMFDDSPSESAKPKAKAKDQKSQAGDAQKKGDKKEKKVFSPEVLERLEENYTIALAKFESGDYYEAKEYVEKIRSIDPEYKDTPTLAKLIEEGYEELIRLKKEEEEDRARQERKLRVEKLLIKARDAVKRREVAVSESILSEIFTIEPENSEALQLKIEIDAYKKEQEEIRKKEEAEKKRRQALVDALAPGKKLYLKKEWFKAIDLLEKFLTKKNVDEDLIKEATTMLSDARVQLDKQVAPLLKEAQSREEGRDLKGAYELYTKILRIDPLSEEALNKRESIFDKLLIRSRKVYREGLISESLSLFKDAKEKFQEVQQISPVNSEYYIKASDKLKNYLD